MGGMGGDEFDRWCRWVGWVCPFAIFSVLCHPLGLAWSSVSVAGADCLCLVTSIWSLVFGSCKLLTSV